MNEYITQQDCPNLSCANYGKHDDENIAVHDKKLNRLRCRLCGKTWSAHYKEFNYGLRSEQSSVRRAIELLRAGIPTRKIAGFVKVSPSTIQRWKTRLKNIL